jgi:hypothetical protein
MGDDGLVRVDGMDILCTGLLPCTGSPVETTHALSPTMFDAAHKKRRPHACLQGAGVASQDPRRDNARVVSNDGCPEHKNRRPTTPVSVGHAKSCGAIQLKSHTADEWDAYVRGLIDVRVPVCPRKRGG